MITQTVEYALRAIVYLADQGGDARTTEQIAVVTRVPKAYLSKVLGNLGRAGLVRSQRGLHGGFSLEKDPAKLVVLEIINAVDPIPRIRSCPLDLAAHGVQLCPLHRRLDDAMALVEKAFADTTISEILADSAGSLPLCDFPRLDVSGDK